MADVSSIPYEEMQEEMQPQFSRSQVIAAIASRTDEPPPFQSQVVLVSLSTMPNIKWQISNDSNNSKSIEPASPMNQSINQWRLRSGGRGQRDWAVRACDSISFFTSGIGFHEFESSPCHWISMKIEISVGMRTPRHWGIRAYVQNSISRNTVTP